MIINPDEYLVDLMCPDELPTDNLGIVVMQLPNGLDWMVLVHNVMWDEMLFTDREARTVGDAVIKLGTDIGWYRLFTIEHVLNNGQVTPEVASLLIDKLGVENNGFDGFYFPYYLVVGAETGYPYSKAVPRMQKQRIREAMKPLMKVLRRRDLTVAVLHFGPNGVSDSSDATDGLGAVMDGIVAEFGVEIII